MQSSNQPGKISVPFANSGQKQPIPVASQIGIEDGRASYTDGFPPLTRTPLSAGGKPPFGTDMNGILNAISLIQQWQSAGGLFKYDSAFSAAVGGYPKGAVLVKSSGGGLWQSTVENNTTDPDAGGAGWSGIQSSGQALFTSNGTFVVPPGVTTIYVSGCAGGGGGGSSLASDASSYLTGGSGGGAGQSIIDVPFTVTPGQTLAITVGAGGSGGTATQNNATAGTASQVGSLVTLAGGLPGARGGGGTAISDYGGPGGGAGYPNGDPASDTNVFSSSFATGGNGGKGGGSPFGNPGPPGRGSVSSNNAGAPGYGFGAGGSGSGGAYKSSSSIPGAAGAAGRPGLIVIKY